MVARKDITRQSGRSAASVGGSPDQRTRLPATTEGGGGSGNGRASVTPPNSQCHGTRVARPHVAQSGCTQPKRLAFSWSQKKAASRQERTRRPVPKSTARPHPWLERPGRAVGGPEQERERFTPVTVSSPVSGSILTISSSTIGQRRS